MLQKGLPIYTFRYLYAENKEITLGDGTTKLIVNSKAFEKVADKDLKVFLQYLNERNLASELVDMIENEIGKIKENETLREEYMQYSPLIMDARPEGAYQQAVETARILKQLGDSISKINESNRLARRRNREAVSRWSLGSLRKGRIAPYIPTFPFRAA